MKACNIQTGSEDDHYSTARKNNNKQGESVVDVDKDGEEVQSQNKATTSYNKKDDFGQTSATQGDRIEDTHTQIKKGVGDDIEAEEDLRPNIKEVAKSRDLSPWSVRDLNKEKRKGRSATSKNSQIQTRSAFVRPPGSK